MKLFRAIASALVVMAAALIPKHSDACSRVVYIGSDTTLIVVGRSLDWKTPIPTNLYVYPRGMEKKGNNLPGSVEWTSKYGSVYAVGYDGGITEGMNEKGLSVNGLFCKGTVYVNSETDKRAPMSLAMFVAWMLDNNATTKEVVAELKKQEFTIGGATFDGGTVSALHWGITDALGETAVLEFDNGQVKIFEGKDLRVLTNDPQFPQMQAIEAYWKKIDGTHFLPGTVSSPDRFVRADFFAHNVEPVADPDIAVSITRSIVMNVSVPYLYTVNGEPNVSSTQWRSYSNLRDKRYYFDIVTNPGMYYIDLTKCDLRKGAHVMKLDTSDTKNLVGDVTSHLKKSAPFTPMY